MLEAGSREESKIILMWFLSLLSVHFLGDQRWLMIYWVFTELDRSVFVGAVVLLSSDFAL